jgi:2-keto-4-pentenoate hydratase/2-oxohepta-3-ene-1,7-dioic acid hydratase in catechol pathway
MENRKYIRYFDRSDNKTYYGLLEADRVQPLSGPPWLGGEPVGAVKVGEALKLQAPVEPSKIVCIGLNYHAHVKASYSADEAPDYPLIFLKPPSAIIGPEELIHHPPQSERVDYEAELGVVIGRTARQVAREQADEYIFGLTCANDVTARDLQKKDGQWSRAKGFDTFCPTGPWIVTGIDYRDILVEGILNGKVMQSGRTAQMIFPVDYLVSYVSSVMTLNPGDLLCTGTPSGISPMKPRDAIEVRIENVGSLVNHMAG